MNVEEHTYSEASTSQAFALLTIDDLSLLIPRHEIRSLVSVADIHAGGETEKNAIAYIAFENKDWPVFSLSRELIPLQSITDSHRICVILHMDNKYIGVLCDQIQNIEQQQTHRLKPCMSRSDSPILGLLIYDNAVACETSTKRLNTFLAAI